MEFLDEESKPKFQFQSRLISSSSPDPEISKINKPVAFICVTFSILIFTLTILSISILPDTIAFILFWFSISFLVGPFAPTSLTAGDIRVGQGELLEDPADLDEIDEYPKKNRRNKSRRNEEIVSSPPLVVVGEEKSEKLGKRNLSNGEKDLIFEEKDWSDADFDLLKKQITKYPVGTPRRWEMIAEVFKGRHGVDNVIKMAKSMPERKPGSGDSFTQFLKQRKPLDKRMEEGNGDIAENGEVKKENSNGDASAWSSAEDIALLNALKAFPKEVSMRWEKIAVAVPGKSKAACMKRVTELKKGFRSSKASTE